MVEKYRLKKLGKNLNENLNDWRTFKVFANREHIKANIIRIYGDVVQLSENLIIQDSDDFDVVLIVARRIEVNTGSQIVVNRKKNEPFRLVVYAMEIPLDLNVELKSAYNTVTNKILSNHNCKHIGGTLLMRNGQFKDIRYFEKFDDKIFQREPFNIMLQFSLQIACALFFDEPEITKSILTWIIEIKSQSQSAMIKELYHHGLASFELFNLFKGRMDIKDQVRFIPLLDKKQYWKYIKTFMKTAKSYEIEYMALLESRDINKIEKERLEMLLSDCNDAIQTFLHFEDEGNDLYKSAFEVMKKAERDLEKRQEDVSNARIALEKGINDWKNQKQHDARMQIVTAIFELSLTIGKIVIQPTSIANLGEIVKNVSNSVQNIFKDASIKKIIEIYGSEDVKQIEELFSSENVEKIRNISDKICEITKLKNELESNRDMADDHKINIECESGKIESMNIDELAKKTMIGKFELKQDDYNHIALLLFEHLINLKCWITIYMENYRCAYEYWSLSESKQKLSVIKKFSEYEEDMKYMACELERAYQRFQGEPQVFIRTINISDENHIEEFKRNRFITFEIPLDHPQLSMIDHARLNKFQVFLEGVGMKNDEILLYINSSNTFSDRYQGINYHFKAATRKT
ncbi:369_t:CDS:2 [Racocetra fulgida]|uniref:369_t:CDS:1 n=1 Tax=Racocetra fulgida TaxID=60492 RepID=A0A9N8ZGY1_9GLOM|nr:369_t:CDS:2 [Racocetra fulgida]